MAQATKPRDMSSTGRGGSRANSSGSKKAAAPKRSRSGAKQTSSQGKRAKSRRAGASRPRAQSRANSGGRNAAAGIKDTAIDRTKAVGHAVAGAASRAKTPLIVGGTALAGAAAAAVIKDRRDANRSNGPLKLLRSMSMPRMDLHELDLGTVKSVADRVSAYGQQASDIAAAVEKTRNND
jgi:hypothetical protein